jgi:hypothetical protein
MERMLAVKRAILVQFKLFLSIPPVFLGSIVSPFAFTTLKRNQFHSRLFTRHIKPLQKQKTYAITALQILFFL